MFQEFFTPEMLITFAGCALATGVITEMFKKIGFLANLRAQLVSYFVAFIILLGATLTLGQFTWSGLFMMLLNAAVVSLAANGGYDLVDKVVEIGEIQEEEALLEEALAMEPETVVYNIDTGVDCE